MYKPRVYINVIDYFYLRSNNCFRILNTFGNNDFNYIVFILVLYNPMSLYNLLFK